MGSQNKASLVSPPPSLKMKVFLSILALVPLSGLARGQDSSEYKFRYRVKDAQQGQDFGQVEEKQGENTGGEYQVLLPDGRTQVVSYSASEPAGFLARVEYQGEVTLPDEPLQYLRTPKRLRPVVEDLLLANRASLPPAKRVTDRQNSLAQRLGGGKRVLTVKESGIGNGNVYKQDSQIIKQASRPKYNKIKNTSNKNIFLKPILTKKTLEVKKEPLIPEREDVKVVQLVTTETAGSPVFKTNTEPPKMKYKDSDFKAASTKVLNSLFREDVLEKTLKL